MNATDILNHEATMIHRDRQIIANALYVQRIARNMSHDDIRRATGVNISEYHSLESARPCLVSIHMLKMICEAMGLKLSEIIKETEK